MLAAMSDLRLRSVTMKPGFAMADGLANILTGRGTSVDRSAHNLWLRRSLTPVEIEAAYRTSWLIRKIVDVPAEDMTRAGRDWDADDADIAKIEAEEKRLGVWAAVRTALIYARLGGGALFINYADRRPDLPLPPNAKPQGVESIVPLYRTQISLGAPIDDLLDPSYGEPSEIRVNTPARPLIHPSRLIVFKGKPVPAIYTATYEDRYWGDSVVQSVNEAVQNATTATAGFASLIDEAKLDVYRMDQLAEQLIAGNEAVVQQRVTLTNAGKSTHRAIILDKEDEWDHRQVTWAGIPDVIKTFLAVVAGAADIPATRLLGKSPDGMNATGEGDESAYFQSIGAQQEMALRPALEKLDAVVLPSAGVASKDLSWKFSTLKVLTEQQESEIDAKDAETALKYANSGLIPESALAKATQGRMIESGRWPGLKRAIEEAEAAGEELPDDDPSALQATETTNGGKEADPTSAGGGFGRPARRAANDAATWLADATPRPLYVQRKLLNARDLIAWAKENGFASTLEASDLHVTVLYSRAAVDPMKMGRDWREDEKGQLIVRPGGPRVIERLGENAVVLRFASPDLEWRHRDMVEAGGSHDYPEYAPHVTISYAVPDGVDLDALKPFNGELRFGPEIFEALDLDWKSKIVEDGGAPTGDRPFGDANPYRWGRGPRGGQYKSGPGGGGSPAAYVDRVLGGASEKQRPMGAVATSTANLVKRQTGLDIRGLELRLDAGGVRHAWASHGPNGKVQGARAITKSEILRAPTRINTIRSFEPSAQRGINGKRFVGKYRTRNGEYAIIYETNGKAVYPMNMYWVRK